MATVQIDGSSAVTKSSTVNNGGTAMNVGSSSSVLDNRSLGAANVGVFGSTPYDGADADKVISAGVFAHNHLRGIILTSTTELAGQSSDVLKSAGSTPVLTTSVHKVESATTVKTTSGIRANKYNRFTGDWDSGYPQTSTDSFGNDDAARSSRSVPGELTYSLGKTPVQADYSAKNG